MGAAGETGFNCRLSIHGLCEGFRVLDRYAELQACEILDHVFAAIDVSDLYERVVAERSEVALVTRRKAHKAELLDLDSQEERLIDAVAAGAVAQEPARRKTEAISKRRADIRDELRQMSHSQETHTRALEYVEQARQIGIGRLVANMDIKRRRRFFRGAFKSLTLDGKGSRTVAQAMDQRL